MSLIRNSEPNPLITVVTVTYNDAWALSKTIRSIAMQQFENFEYIVVDGSSTDTTQELLLFWQELGVISQFRSEIDSGVYDAMNKGIDMANGKYVCFMNAGDVFKTSNELQFAHDTLSDSDCSGLLGWGMLKDQIWASWYLTSDSVRMSSLGFCHQSLFLGLDWLKKFKFDAASGKTDSDTKQLANCIAEGAQIISSSRIMSIRSPSEGLSANLEVSATSIIQTLLTGYSNLSERDAETIVAFRRTCSDPSSIIGLLARASDSTKFDLAIMILDTVYLRQAKVLSSSAGELLIKRALEVLDASEYSSSKVQWQLSKMLKEKVKYLAFQARSTRNLEVANNNIELDLRGKGYLAAIVQKSEDYVISLTTFPARIRSVHLVIKSLLAQSKPAREVILNVGRDEFKNQWAFPQALTDLIGKGLTVEFVDRTAHQYDKFLHNRSINKDSKFVIVDDDVIYPPDAMALLLDESENHPNCVIANRCHRIKFDPDNNILPYSLWDREVFLEEPSHALIATGAGGVLYPKGFFEHCASDKTIMALCPYADDIWLKVMSLSMGVEVKSTQHSLDSWKLGYTPDMNEFALHEGNVGFGLNDIQIKKALRWLEQQNVDWRVLVSMRSDS